MMLSSIVAPVFASTNTKQASKVNLAGVWAFNYVTSGGVYPHTMIISSFNPCTGAFSGTGYYNVDPTYTWTVTGTESGNTLTLSFNILYTGTGAGYAVTAVGTIASCTSMSGTAIDSNSVSATWTATKANLVVNVSWIVLNDEDYRWGAGCWALDNGMQSVQVWQLSTDNYVAIKTYNEMFYTPKGAISPVVGTVETKAGTGTMNAQYIVSIAGPLATGVQLTGCLGVKNYGGSISDILLGTGAQGAPKGYSWLGQYFPSVTSFPSANVIFRSDYWQYTLLCDKTAVSSSLLETNAYQQPYYNPVILATPTAVGDITT
ncbi:MAG: hypothetical protein ABSD42_02705 [Candidatus Bathyarchaeia archaeon]